MVPRMGERRYHSMILLNLKGEGCKFLLSSSEIVVQRLHVGTLVSKHGARSAAGKFRYLNDGSGVGPKHHCGRYVQVTI